MCSYLVECLCITVYRVATILFIGSTALLLLSAATVTAGIDRNRNFQSRHILARISRSGHWKELQIWCGLMLLRTMRKQLAVDIPPLKCYECACMGKEVLGDDAPTPTTSELAVVPSGQLEVAENPPCQIAAEVGVSKPFVIPDPPAIDADTFTNLRVRGYADTSSSVRLQNCGRVVVCMLVSACMFVM